jgi:hypothetical protein
MIAMVTAFRMFSDGVLDRLAERAEDRRTAAAAETRLKALAAVAAITALRRSARSNESSDDADA